MAPGGEGNNSSGGGNTNSLLECYVCLPGDKTSTEAKAILALFPREGNYSIPDCIAFADHNAHQFLFPCPASYKGCSRHMGPEPSLVSRNCAKMGIDSCGNSDNAEYCFCTGSKCNGAKALPVFPTKATKVNQGSSTPHTWTALETDDEDLLPKEDEEGVDDEGSGSYGPEQPPDNTNNGGGGGGGGGTDRQNKGHEKWDTYPHQRKFFPSTHKHNPGNKGQTASTATTSSATTVSRAWVSPIGVHCLVVVLLLLVGACSA